MVLEPVLCPTCASSDVVKLYQSSTGNQRYKYRNCKCSRCTFIQNYAYWEYLPAVKQHIANMAVNGSGTRDTARVIKVSRTMVIKDLKKIFT